MTTTVAQSEATGAFGVSGYSEQLPCEAEAVGRARAFVSSSLDTWGLREELADTGELIMSELMTNVVAHTGTDLTTVAIQRGSRLVRIEVADSSSTTPRIESDSGSAQHGRGLLLVDALSSHWGYVKHPWGKVIWAELLVSER
ncbi:ATP-binding protein [Streptomyces sp. NPDC054871]